MSKQALASLSIDSLKAELERRQKAIEKLRERQQKLVEKRDAIQAKLEAQVTDLNGQISNLESEITVLGGEVGLAEIGTAFKGVSPAEVSKEAAKVFKVDAPETEAEPVAEAVEKPSTKKSTKKTTKKTAKPGRKASGSALGDVIAEVLPKTGTGMKIPEIMKAVLDSGYETTSKNFRTIVSQTLRDKRFKKTGRGLYIKIK